MARQTKLTITGTGETGDKIHCKISFKKKTDDPVVKDATGNDAEVLQTRPPGLSIIEEIVGENPTWVKIGGKWYKIG